MAQFPAKDFFIFKNLYHVVPTCQLLYIQHRELAETQYIFVMQFSFHGCNYYCYDSWLRASFKLGSGFQSHHPENNYIITHQKPRENPPFFPLPRHKWTSKWKGTLIQRASCKHASHQESPPDHLPITMAIGSSTALLYYLTEKVLLRGHTKRIREFCLLWTPARNLSLLSATFSTEQSDGASLS